LFRPTYDNFVSTPRFEGIGPTRLLLPRLRNVRPVRVERVEGRESVKRLLFRTRDVNFVIWSRFEGIGPTRLLLPRERNVRQVRVERDEGREPVKRFVLKSRYDNLTHAPRAEGMAPESWLLLNERDVSWDIPQISEGTEPVKDFQPKFRAITSPDTEQVRPVHTGDEHLLATLAQLQAGIMDWMLVELMRAHRAELSSPRAATVTVRWEMRIMNQRKKVEVNKLILGPLLRKSILLQWSCWCGVEESLVLLVSINLVEGLR
jgi:hypothetical protein